MILLYNVSDLVIEVLQEMQLSYRIISDDMLHETIGYLFNIKDFKKTASEKTYRFAFDAMIIHEVDDQVLQEVIKKLKASHSNVERKAMLTEHNKHWTMGDLLKEIDSEHTYFQYYDGIMNALKEAEHLHPEEYQKETWQNYQNAFVSAYETLQSRPDDVNMMIQTYDSLNEAKAALRKKG